MQVQFFHYSENKALQIRTLIDQLGLKGNKIKPINKNN